jgi:hypothetical protein
MSADEITLPSQGAIKSFLAKFATYIQPFYAHASAQAIALITVATHDVSKWEAAIATLGTAAGTSIIKKIGAWLGVTK